MNAKELKRKLIIHFNLFKDQEILYYTSDGRVFRQEDLEELLKTEPADNIRTIQKPDLFNFELGFGNI